MYPPKPSHAIPMVESSYQTLKFCHSKTVVMEKAFVEIIIGPCNCISLGVTILQCWGDATPLLEQRNLVCQGAFSLGYTKDLRRGFSNLVAYWHAIHKMLAY